MENNIPDKVGDLATEMMKYMLVKQATLKRSVWHLQAIYRDSRIYLLLTYNLLNYLQNHGGIVYAL